MKRPAGKSTSGEKSRGKDRRGKNQRGKDRRGKDLTPSHVLSKFDETIFFSDSRFHLTQLVAFRYPHAIKPIFGFFFTRSITETQYYDGEIIMSVKHC